MEISDKKCHRLNLYGNQKDLNRIILRHIEIHLKSVAKIQNKDPVLQKSDWLLHAIDVNKVAMWLKCDVLTFCVCRHLKSI